MAFSAEQIKDGDTRFKCAPPIRDEANRKKLWQALMVFNVSMLIFYFIFIIFPQVPDIIFAQDGHIDMLSSDHSPSAPELKLFDQGDFLRAWGGISSLQVNTIKRKQGSSK